MSRELISRADLKTRLTKEIQKYQGCEACKLTGITPLQIPDEEGCNWSSDITLSTGLTTKELCVPIALEIIKKAQKLFNITED